MSLQESAIYNMDLNIVLKMVIEILLWPKKASVIFIDIDSSVYALLFFYPPFLSFALVSNIFGILKGEDVNIFNVSQFIELSDD